MLHAREQWSYLPCSRRFRSLKPFRTCPVLALNAIGNAPLHSFDKRVAPCRQVLVALSSRAIVCGRRSGVCTLPHSRLGRVSPLDAALYIQWRVRGSHRGRCWRAFIEKGGRERCASQSSSETLLPFDIGVLSGSVWRRSNPGHNAALEHLQRQNGRWLA